MPPDPDLHALAQELALVLRELIPGLRNGLGEPADWPAETLIRRREIFRAHFRDTIVRILGIKDPPPRAGREWWREVANQADGYALRLSDELELAKLLSATDDDEGVTYLCAALLTVGLMNREWRRRVEATGVGRALRGIILNEQEAESLDLLWRTIRPPRRAGWDTPDRYQGIQEQRARSFETLFAFYERACEKAARGEIEKGYGELARSPLGGIRPVAEAEWEQVAGELLIEDIRDAQRYLLPLLRADIDTRARWAVRDAEREQQREAQAKARGGPGLSWTCSCNLANQLRVTQCPTCGDTRPPPTRHVALEDDLSSPEPGPDHSAYVNAALDNIRRRYGDSPAVRALERLALGLAETAAEACRAEGVAPKTLETLRRKLQRDY